MICSVVKSVRTIGMDIGKNFGKFVFRAWSERKIFKRNLYLCILVKSIKKFVHRFHEQKSILTQVQSFMFQVIISMLHISSRTYSNFNSTRRYARLLENTNQIIPRSHCTSVTSRARWSPANAYATVSHSD